MRQASDEFQALGSHCFMCIDICNNASSPLKFNMLYASLKRSETLLCEIQSSARYCFMLK